jgi:hypothetical protein
MPTIRYERKDGTGVTVEGSHEMLRAHLAEERRKEARQVVNEEPLIAPTLNFGNDLSFFEPQSKQLVTQDNNQQEPLIAPTLCFGDRPLEVTNQRGTKPQRDLRRTSHEADGKETPLISPEMVF